jgi:small-conductance mechanosensitive channel
VGCPKKAFAQARAIIQIEHECHALGIQGRQGLRKGWWLVGGVWLCNFRHRGEMMTPETGQFDDALMTFSELSDLLMRVLLSLVTPGWRQNQIFILIGLAIVAWGLHRVTGSLLDHWVRGREGWAKWQLRVIVQVKRRLGLIWFALLAFVVYLVMQQITWPSRSYLIGVGATLGAVWVGIAFAARLVRNRFLRRTVTWGLWIYATLYMLRAEDDVSLVLDDVALHVGEFRLSLLTVITAAVAIGFFFTLARVASATTTSSIRKNEDISPSMQVLAVKAVQIVFYGIALFMGVKAVGIDLTGLAVLSGAIGVGLGFGLQKVVSNLVSGVIILLDKSIKPGDVISLGETFGWINALGARYVSVVTRDGKEYLIPNEDLITGQVVNWSHSNEFVRLDIYFGTAYGDDPHLVRKIAIDASSGVNRVLATPKPPVCHIVGFGDSSVDYILRFWIKDPTSGLTNIRGDVYLALWDAFREHDISIPFPQREVRMLGD